MSGGERDWMGFDCWEIREYGSLELDWILGTEKDDFGSELAKGRIANWGAALSKSYFFV